MVAIFKFFKKIFLMGHNTKLVGHVPHLGYATDTLTHTYVMIQSHLKFKKYAKLYSCISFSREHKVYQVQCIEPTHIHDRMVFRRILLTVYLCITITLINQLLGTFKNYGESLSHSTLTILMHA